VVVLRCGVVVVAWWCGGVWCGGGGVMWCVVSCGVVCDVCVVCLWHGGGVVVCMVHCTVTTTRMNLFWSKNLCKKSAHHDVKTQKNYRVRILNKTKYGDDSNIRTTFHRFFKQKAIEPFIAQRCSVHCHIVKDSHLLHHHSSAIFHRVTNIPQLTQFAKRKKLQNNREYILF
jgi:hypothetical protein